MSSNECWPTTPTARIQQVVVASEKRRANMENLDRGQETSVLGNQHMPSDMFVMGTLKTSQQTCW